MKKILCLCLLAGFVLASVALAKDAEARPPCPPGYFWDGPRGCMAGLAANRQMSTRSWKMCR